MLRHLLLFVALAAPAVPAFADSPDRDTGGPRIGSARFAAGDSVRFGESTEGNAFGAGGQVDLDGQVAGNAYMTGGQVAIRAPVERSLYAAGASILVGAPVKGDARLFGETIEVLPAARIGGGASMIGRTLTMDGAVAGDLTMAGRQVTLLGTVGGDAEIAATRIEIGADARVGGKLRYRSDQEPLIATGAQIVGGIERLPGTARDHWRWGGGHGLHGLGSVLGVGGSFVLGALLLLVVPGFLAETTRIATSRWPESLGIGVGVLIAVPIAAVLLFITLIGIPVGLLALWVYVVVLALGYVVGAVALGDVALGRLAPERTAAIGWRVLSLLAALVLLKLLAHVPVVGAVLAFAVFLTGVGALCLRSSGRGSPPREVAA